MAVSLTKIVDGSPVITDTLLNEQTVKCSFCEQTFRLGYSDGEWHRLKDWVAIAEHALREDHKNKHQINASVLQLRPLRRRSARA